MIWYSSIKRNRNQYNCKKITHNPDHTSGSWSIKWTKVKTWLFNKLIIIFERHEKQRKGIIFVKVCSEWKAWCIIMHKANDKLMKKSLTLGEKHRLQPLLRGQQTVDHIYYLKWNKKKELSIRKFNHRKRLCLFFHNFFFGRLLLLQLAVFKNL